MNTSHYHQPATDADDLTPAKGADGKPLEHVEVEGLAEHCDLCRRRKGLKPLSEIERRFAGAGLRADGGSGSGNIPADEAMRMLVEQEEISDELRQKVKELSDENATLRKALKKREPVEVS